MIYELHTATLPKRLQLAGSMRAPTNYMSQPWKWDRYADISSYLQILRASRRVHGEVLPFLLRGREYVVCPGSFEEVERIPAHVVPQLTTVEVHFDYHEFGDEVDRIYESHEFRSKFRVRRVDYSFDGTTFGQQASKDRLHIIHTWRLKNLKDTWEVRAKNVCKLDPTKWRLCFEYSLCPINCCRLALDALGHMTNIIAERHKSNPEEYEKDIPIFDLDGLKDYEAPKAWALLNKVYGLPKNDTRMKNGESIKGVDRPHPKNKVKDLATMILNTQGAETAGLRRSSRNIRHT